MADKTYFCFLLEWADTFNLLNEEQCGKLIKAMIVYEKDGTEPEFSDDILSFAWLSNIKPKFDKLKEHYNDKRKQAFEAGKASAERRKQNQQALTKVKNDEQNERTLTDVETVEQKQQALTDSTNIDLDLDIDLDKREEVEEEKGTPQKYLPILEAWNRLPLTNIRMISGKRLKLLQARIKQYSFDDVLKAIENIHASPFLLGKNQRSWQIHFDWFILPTNFAKVLEGNYKEVKVDGTASDNTVPKQEYGTVI